MIWSHRVRKSHAANIVAYWRSPSLALAVSGSSQATAAFARDASVGALLYDGMLYFVDLLDEEP